MRCLCPPIVYFGAIICRTQNIQACSRERQFSGLRFYDLICMIVDEERTENFPSNITTQTYQLGRWYIIRDVLNGARSTVAFQNFNGGCAPPTLIYPFRRRHRHRLLPIHSCNVCLFILHINPNNHPVP